MTDRGPGESFACACCGGEQSVPAGTYALPTRMRAGAEVGLVYRLRECLVCGHVQAHPRPSEVDLARYYTEDFWEQHGVRPDLDGDWLEQLTSASGPWERFQRGSGQARYLRDAGGLDPGARIIDLGSGLSPVLYHCRQLGFTELYALEPSRAVCEYLDRQGITTYPMLLEEFVDRDDLPEFDAMVISHTVEHLVDPHVVLEGLKRHLRPGGVLYIDVPYRDDQFPHHEGLHLHFFGPRSMAHLLHRSGFELAASEVDHLTRRDRAVLSSLHWAYGRLYGSRGGLGPSAKVEWLHRVGWRPLTRVLGLNVKIFISKRDLRVVARA